MALSSLVLCVSLVAASVDPPAPRKQPLPVLPQWGIEVILRGDLARTKRGRAFLEETIEMFEQHLKEPSLTPQDVDYFRRKIATFREAVAKMKKVEQVLELWEKERKENPGTETDFKAIDRLDALLKEWDRPARPTAPMPREVKPKPPAPTPQK